MSVHRIYNRSCSIEQIKQITLTTGLAIGGIIATGSVMPAGAFSLFFGEDVSANRNASNIPNSQAAEAAFLSQLTGSQSEGFESIITGFSQTTALTNATITTNLATSGVSDLLINPITGLPTGRFPIGGTKYYEVGSAGSNTTTTITFNNSIAAFGFYATDIENLEGIQIQLNDSANTLLTWTRTAAIPVSGSAMYYGIVAENLGETFTSATFSLSPVTPDKQQDRFGLDNLSFATFVQLKAPGSATAVPEPFTVIGTLIGGTAAFRIRKRLKSNQ